jgi:hypothetical protein
MWAESTIVEFCHEVTTGHKEATALYPANTTLPVNSPCSGC